MSEAYFVDCHGYFVELLTLMKLQTSKHVFDCRDADRFVIMFPASAIVLNKSVAFSVRGCQQRQKYSSDTGLGVIKLD